MRLVFALAILLLSGLDVSAAGPETAARLPPEALGRVVASDRLRADEMLKDVRIRRDLFRAFAVLADRRVLPLTGADEPLLVALAEGIDRYDAKPISTGDTRFRGWGSEHCGLICDGGAWLMIDTRTGDVAAALATPYDTERRYAKGGTKTVFVMSCAEPALKQAVQAMVAAEGPGLRGRSGWKEGPPVHIVETPCR
jgi:hypothetical protein